MKNKINQYIKSNFNHLYDEQAQNFKNLIINNLAHHAWLITGNAGIDKIDFIYNVVKKIFTDKLSDYNQRDYINSQIENNIYSNLMLINKQNDKKNISIEDIRKISKFLTLSSSDSNFKIIIIDNIDDFNINSANALLKILEEPPNNCFLFLINNKESKILKTIKSRCNIVRLKIPKYKYKEDYNEDIDFKILNDLLYITNNSIFMTQRLLNFELFDYYNELLSILNNKLDITRTNKLIDKIIINTQNDSNLIVAIMFDHILLKIVKNCTDIEFRNIIDQEEISISKISSRKKIDQWFKIYQQQKILLNEQIKSNLDLKQVFLIIVTMIQDY